MSFEENLLEPRDRYFSSFDESFEVGDSPVILDVKASLNAKGIDGEIKCINASTGITAEISSDGTNYGDAIFIEPLESISLQSLQVSKIRLTRLAADSGYRVFVI